MSSTQTQLQLTKSSVMHCIFKGCVCVKIIKPIFQEMCILSEVVYIYPVNSSHVWGQEGEM